MIQMSSLVGDCLMFSRLVPLPNKGGPIGVLFDMAVQTALCMKTKELASVVQT